MPTPYGSRGGMAFGAEELRVLRRALALAPHASPGSAEDVQDCRRLAESLDEAMHEGARLRAFLVADLARYRAALPGTAAGYLTLLDEVLGAGCRPDPDDIAALRALRGNPAAAALLDRCQALAEQGVHARLAHGTDRQASPTVPACRTRLTALPGGLTGGLTDGLADDEEREPARKPEKKPAEKPAAPKPGPAPAPPAPKPSRPIPTPGEVFPRRKPPTPPTGAGLPQQLAAG